MADPTPPDDGVNIKENPPRKRTLAKKAVPGRTQRPAEREPITEQRPLAEQIQPRYYFFHNGEPRRIETPMSDRVIFYATSTGGRQEIPTDTLITEQDGWRAPITEETQLSDGFTTFLTNNSAPESQRQLEEDMRTFIEGAPTQWGLDTFRAANLAIQMAVELHRRAEGSTVMLNHSEITKPYMQKFLASLRGMQEEPTEQLSPTPEEDRKLKIMYDVARAFELDATQHTSEHLFQELAPSLSDVYDKMNTRIIPIATPKVTTAPPLLTRRSPSSGSQIAQAGHGEDTSQE